MSNSTAQLKVPSVGESVSEVEVSSWLKKEGDTVRQDENVVVLETDKATLEVPSPVTGRLLKIAKQKGERVQIGDLLAEIEAVDGSTPTTPPAEKKNDAVPAPAKEVETETTKPVRRRGERDSSKTTEPSEAPIATPPSSQPAPAEAAKLPAAPAAPPPGPGSGPGAAPQPEFQTPAASTKPESPVPKSSDAGRAEEIVPMSLLRRKIAQHLVAAQHTAALLTTFNEVDMSAVMALRKENQDRFQERYQIKLGFMSFFIKATVEGLKEYPQLNAEIRGNDIVYRNYHDVAIAIGGGRGLVVPVLRNAGRMSFAEIERGIADFAQRVKENKIKPEELQGGTFTITNGGVYGSLLSTPLVNPPQSGVLGMHAIQERPIALAGQVVIRPMMYIALTYDHRLVDGREAVQFLKRVKDLIESPARMLIET